MNTEHTPHHTPASLGLGAALALALLALAAGEGDPESMSLGVLPLLIIGAIAYTVASSHDRPYRWAVRIALGATFVLFWGIGATSFMGTDDQHPADAMYILVPVVEVIGALLARFRPLGMARTMFATAAVLMLIPSLAVLAGLNLRPISAAELGSFTLLMNGPFAVLFIGSGMLFRGAARTQPSAGAGGMGGRLTA